MHPVRFTIKYPCHFGGLYGLNALYQGIHWAKRKAAADFWHSLVTIELMRQKIPKKIFEKPVEITFWWDDRLDLSNEAYAAKLIEDALKGYLIADDGKKYVQGISHKIHNKKCIEVEVKEIAP